VTPIRAGLRLRDSRDPMRPEMKKCFPPLDRVQRASAKEARATFTAYPLGFRCCVFVTATLLSKSATSATVVQKCKPQERN
jgi:hypothetical protein